jgi:hypothetical protein
MRRVVQGTRRSTGSSEPDVLRPAERAVDDVETCLASGAAYGQKLGAAACTGLCALGLLLATSFAACAGGRGAGGSGTGVAVRVGDATITRATVRHWSALFAKEPREPGQTPDRLALRYLIVSAWTTGEAAQKGAAVSDSAGERGTGGGQRSPAGADASAGVSEWTGRSSADRGLETSTELAAEQLRRYVEGREREATHVSRSQVVRYWKHAPRFVHGERRTFHFIESLRSPAAGRRLRRELAQGAVSVARVSVLETREPWHDPGEANAPIHRAIFRAPLHVLEGPLPWNGVYAMFEVVRASPPGRWPLATVSRSIERQLADDAQARVRLEFAAAWRAKWRALTDCSPGFVISLCRQYRGRGASEPVPFQPASG